MTQTCGLHALSEQSLERDAPSCFTGAELQEPSLAEGNTETSTFQHLMEFITAMLIPNVQIALLLSCHSKVTEEIRAARATGVQPFERALDATNQ